MRLKLMVVAVAVVLFSFGTAFGQDYAISLDSVAGLVVGTTDELAIDVPVTFYLRLTNPGAPNEAKIPGYSTGFRVYSPDDASWTPITWVPYLAMDPWPPHTVVYLEGWDAAYDNFLSMNPYSVSGSGADTIGFAGAQTYGGGMPPGFDAVAFTISTQVAEVDRGKQLCLDSTWYPPENQWMWSSDTGVAGVSTGDINPTWDGPQCFFMGDGEAVTERASGLPDKFELYQNFPNPFNPTTTINFDVPVKSHVTLDIYNVLGQRVRTLVDRVLSAGRWTEDWDGRAQDGARAASGIYFYRVEAGDFLKTRKMMLLK